jgi:regulator of sirC expression with transglutaminase-like and TPR domain
MTSNPADLINKDAQLRAFASEISGRQIDLGRAALVMVTYADVDLNIEHYLARLDDLAAVARPVAATPQALADFLFKELGYRGNALDYGDARNSFLNKVIDRRLGIPITLAVLYLEIARRLGVRAAGVGLPGHFIVRAEGADGIVYLDPFDGGAVLTPEACLVKARGYTNAALDERVLAPVDARYILIRMLNNLKNAHSRAGDFQRATAVIERLLVLNPDDADEARNLGVLYAQTGREREALRLLEWYADARPEAVDRVRILGYATALAQKMSRWN